ncbi:MAG TPA: hypothetical protein VN253_11330 [Kofleriaceae bacterium]|nr:hypothetical protein [Kofleriaceae bacterium]
MRAADERWPQVRQAALLAAVHAALIAAIWLTSIAVYAVAFAPTRQPAWLAIDALLVAACLRLVHARRDLLGFSALGPRRPRRLAAIAAWALACVAISQWLVVDANAIHLDELNYLATLREGRIVRDGLFPFNLRWLEPLLAGPWNVLPLDDAEALKAINFGGLVVTAVLLVLLLVRLGIRLAPALAAPIFLLASYLGVYAGQNRLVLDPFNYAMFAVLCHTTLRRDHAWLFGVALLAAALNSEKAIYWIPVFGLTAVVRGEPGRLRTWIDAARLTLRCCAPTIAYLAAMRIYLLPSDSVSSLFAEKVHLISFSWLESDLASGLVRDNSFQVLWFPFGAFTIYALLGFTLADRERTPLLMLLVPIMVSVIVATDTRRMLAYSFVVYLPFGYLYLARVLDDLPRRLGAAVFGLVIALVFCEHYLARILDRLGLPPGEPRSLNFALSFAELALVPFLVFAHHAFFRPPRAGALPPPPPATGPPP